MDFIFILHQFRRAVTNNVKPMKINAKLVRNITSRLIESVERSIPRMPVTIRRDY
jgi:hypothetical protein